MKIGELSHKTDVSARMLRYYEEQGLITVGRRENGFRDYDDYLVDRVLKIRGLLDSGIPTRIIADILPCLDRGQLLVVNADPRLRAVLIEQRDKMDERIAILTHNRDALSRYIDAMEKATTDSRPGAPASR